ncbi:hypothetical protein SY83_20935 [Paenibacillus swuensis]|uniref:DUF948 domain-containing protein n=1 Tax=Paenibacillus swuensis TaxID=1178515 RepID=A0A172TND5_9BACL|nr:DUF948 domain-containing protein [Paenibacillus swuensis]ANE48337.1 hypothetical protein SY83_20935 [Paenibacillus swuensis]
MLTWVLCAGVVSIIAFILYGIRVLVTLQSVLMQAGLRMEEASGHLEKTSELADIWLQESIRLAQDVNRKAEAMDGFFRTAEHAGTVMEHTASKVKLISQQLTQAANAAVLSEREGASEARSSLDWTEAGRMVFSVWLRHLQHRTAREQTAAAAGKVNDPVNKGEDSNV